MAKYFVDAWYFIALINHLDQDYAAAARLERTFLRAPLAVTHDGVLMEVMAFYSAFGASFRRLSTSIIRRSMRHMLAFPADRHLFLAGLDFYERRLDKEYSLVDCMSMELMRAQDIRHVVTNDHHFRQAGFTVLSDAP